MVIGFFGSGSGSFSTVRIIALASIINFRGGALLLDDLFKSFCGSTGRRRTPFSSCATAAAWSVFRGYRDGYSASNGETPATLAAAPQTSSSDGQNDDWNATSPISGEHRSSYGGALPLVNGDWCATVASFSNISSGSSFTPSTSWQPQSSQQTHILLHFPGGDQKTHHPSNFLQFS
nr:hypothetical protein Iba_scaffold9903CG0020 [Ipomoea batatas]GME17525.1 hypothetical protein Iba_scaffold18920CG0370 [Ipomoea batatas]